MRGFCYLAQKRGLFFILEQPKRLLLLFPFQKSARAYFYRSTLTTITGVIFITMQASYHSSRVRRSSEILLLSAISVQGTALRAAQTGKRKTALPRASRFLRGNRSESQSLVISSKRQFFLHTQLCAVKPVKCL